MRLAFARRRPDRRPAAQGEPLRPRPQRERARRPQEPVPERETRARLRRRADGARARPERRGRRHVDLRRLRGDAHGERHGNKRDVEHDLRARRHGVRRAVAAALADGDDLWLHGFFKFDWRDTFIRVASVAPVNATRWNVTRDNATAPQYPWVSGCRFYALNALRLVDAPGEYYVDGRSGELWFYPPGGVGRRRAAARRGGRHRAANRAVARRRQLRRLPTSTLATRRGVIVATGSRRDPRQPDGAQRAGQLRAHRRRQLDGCATQRERLRSSASG